MPLTIIPPQYLTDARSPSIGQSFGEALGDTLRYLATNKLQQIEQRQQNQALEDAGYSPAQIKLLNQFRGSPAEQFKIMSSFNTANALQGQQFPGISALQSLPGMQQMQSPTMTNQPLSHTATMNQQQMQPQQGGRLTPRQATLADVLGNLAEQDAIMRTLGKLPVSSPQQGIQNIGQALGALTGQQPTDYRQFQQQPTALTPAQQLAQFPYISPAEQRLEDREARKLEQRERHFTRKEEAAENREIRRETEPYFKQVNEEAKAAKASDIRLDRMEELVKRGNLPSSRIYNTLQSAADIPYVGPLFKAVSSLILNPHPDFQEFEKLSTDFIKDAKKFFGSRVTENEIIAFLKTVPTLSQTDAGKRRVIENLRSFNDIALVKQKAMHDIIKENGGKRPADIEYLVEERTSSEIDKIANKFKKRL